MSITVMLMLVSSVLRSCYHWYRGYYGNGNVGIKVNGNLRIMGIKVILKLVSWVLW